ncbi:CDP-alcohol phosphatidyltransferase family protein [Corynebacterium sp. sy017]|uniref:phosphatidylinositol phosphate synthase n=1 Tax=unclassified Corynebacterium TaxID=2624378 RepID=UPI001184D6EF|nr:MULTISPECIES: CDP-alcohol phosphatidyltransferase family protein [unclassified Corynebacterium]MBP3087730.1 CDP-alcohol phosphatidyltransferase family protein [Corynebacterium sp. sy017]QDZ42706.1 CDP-alcohol phosphatidyltransferase family protein [Corynebacterium sp. sy039]TSD92282.1 CDP-alcohol phosphatidyltransferase family protein [Corynebacterium sp. SY003]
MLSVHARRPAAVFVEPVAKLFLKIGLTPNAVTIIGTVIAILLVVILIPLNHLFAAAALSGLFVAFDMVDGTMARMSGGGTKFGATLDATCDRITDGALFSAIAWWLIYVDNAHPALVAATLSVIVSSQVISYVKARGEASGFVMVGGLIERPERLILGLSGVGLAGLGIPFALEICIWVLAFGSAFTVGQRLWIASSSEHARERSVPPQGARSFSDQEDKK